MRLSRWSAVACAAVLTVAPVGISGQAPRGNEVNAASFTRQAMLASTAEVKLGELAVQKAQSAEVKEFAQMMVKDHTAGLNALKEAVKGQGVDEPAQLDTKHRTLYDRLNKLSGAEFDREYVKAMVDGHREVKNMVETRANRTPTTTGTSGRVSDDSRLDNAVNQWANKALPTVTKHLEMAEQLSTRVK